MKPTLSETEKDILEECDNKYLVFAGRELFIYAIRRATEAAFAATDIENRRPELITQPEEYKGSDANVWREGFNAALDAIKAERKDFLEG